MLRFAILRHEVPGQSPRPTHWDLMLEHGESLATWALASEPCIGAVIEARRLPDHRLVYLDYDGPLSHDRGEVTRWDAGSVQWELDESAHCAAHLCGQRLDCRVDLTCITADTDRWRARFLTPGAAVAGEPAG